MHYIGIAERRSVDVQIMFDDRRLSKSNTVRFFVETADLAARVLVDHLYARTFPSIPGVDVGSAYVPAENNTRVGGDLVDVYQFNNGSMAISVADISGKGAKAAARAALVKYALRAYVSAGLTPAQALRNLNVLYIETSEFDTGSPDSFVSVFLATIEPEHRVMTYASAGHGPAFLLRGGRPAEWLPPTAPIVGVFEESQKLFHQRFVYLEPGGSTLIVTTDGITEARTPDGRFFEQEEFMNCINANRLLPAQQQADQLVGGTRQFSGGRHQDDIAVMVARFP